MLVGPDKLVGYKLIEDLVQRAKVDPEKIKEQLEAKGLKTLMLTDEECSMRSGALYAWHEEGLSAFLAKHASALEQCNWPTEPEAFIRRLAVDWAPEKTKLFDIIADAFNNKDDRRRTDVKAPERGNHYCP